jgi:pilus assembly protein Flp/PilA
MPGRARREYKTLQDANGGEVSWTLDKLERALRFRLGQRGQGMVEYALIVVLVSLVVIIVLITMGAQINNVFSNVVVGLSGS